MTPLQIDMNCVPVIITMQNNGIRIDHNHFSRITQEFRDEADAISAEIEQEYGKRVNVRSGGEDGQLCQMLVDMNIYDRKQPVDKETLSRYQTVPIVQKVLKVKEYEHLISQFTTKIPKMADDNNRIHTDILLTRTSTGRLASKNPNLQNIPTRTEAGRKIRQGFIPEDGCVLVSIDYAAIELRVVAHMARDAKMIQAFANGDDLHTMLAANMFDISEAMVDQKKHRRPAKDVQFGCLYGITKHGLYDGFIKNELVDEHGSPLFDEEDCQRFIDSWFQTWPGCGRYMDSLHRFIELNGYAETMFGRRRQIPHVYSSDGRIREKGIREGANCPIQGTAAEIMKIAMINVMPMCEQWSQVGKCDIIMQVHDELLFEMDEDYWQCMASDIRDVMETAVELKVATPCDTEVSDQERRSWGSMREIERSEI